jgi:hypothetical protein
MEEKIQITSDVFTTSEINYLIKNDNQYFAFAEDDQTAKSILKSICEVEVKKLESSSTKVFQRVLDDGNEIQICTQSLGYLMNGGIKKKKVLRIIPVSKAFSLNTPPVLKSIDWNKYE